MHENFFSIFHDFFDIFRNFWHQNFLFGKPFPFLVVTKKGKLCKNAVPERPFGHQINTFLVIISFFGNSKKGNYIKMLPQTDPKNHQIISFFGNYQKGNYF